MATDRHFKYLLRSDTYGTSAFKTLTELRKSVIPSKDILGLRLGYPSGYVYEWGTNNIVGAIDMGKYVYKQNGKLYCRFINPNGTLDSRYKMKYDGKWIF